MTNVSTVRGDVPASGLGRTLMHEHLIAVSAALANDRPELVYPAGKAAALDQLVAELAQVKDAGIDTIVDLSVYGHDRDVPALVEINARVDLNLVVATGFYTDDEPSRTFYYRQFMARRTAGRNVFAEIFISDLTEGIAGTGVRAGILKCVTGPAGLTRSVTDLMVGCAIAAKETGVPISTHSHPADRNGLDQLALLEKEGVDLTRVIIGHSGDTDDLTYLKRLMDTGAVIGCDRFDMAVPGAPDQEGRARVVAALCKQGYADRIVLSHDKMMYTDWFGDNPLPTPTVPVYVSTHVLPRLRELGVSDPELDQMMVRTPARLLGRLG